MVQYECIQQTNRMSNLNISHDFLNFADSQANFQTISGRHSVVKHVDQQHCTRELSLKTADSA